MHIAVLQGRAQTQIMRSEPDVTVLASEEFWFRVSGFDDFLARLLKASAILAPLVKKRAADEVARIKAEAKALYGDVDGGLNLDAVAAPPKATRRTKRLIAATRPE